MAGVVGLTVVLTTALAGFFVLAESSSRFETDSESEIQLHYAAESAMAMGLRWVRTYSPSPEMDNDAWPATSPVYLNSTVPNQFTLMDGAWVKVEFFASPGEAEKHKLRCFATMGPTGRDTLEIIYYVKLPGLNSENENGTTLYALATAQWRETLHPGH